MYYYNLKMASPFMKKKMPNYYTAIVQRRIT